MEAFSYQQHHPFLLESAYFPSYYSSEGTPEISTADAKTHESSSSLEQVPTPQAKMVKKKVAKESKSKKPAKGKKKHQGDDDVEATMSCEDPPAGYIHVRARRGQATDSHSLAERVRREKISERMRRLQSLVPGCDKVAGKALVLDEIINYVQSLQNQVEFLSMKLASLNPMLYNLCEDYDDYINQEEKMRSMLQPMPSVIQASTHIQPTAHTLMDSSTSLPLHGQGPTNFSQDDERFLVEVGDHSQGFFNHGQFSNMFSLQ